MSDTQIAPDQRLSVTLTAQQWWLLQQLLAEPFRTSQQLIGEIQRQCLAQARAEPPLPEHIPRRPNGGIAEMSDGR